ncbi:MAG: hypothetical protein EOP41_08515 [Sphingobacteriaceae bacterium]|nr:MAG: hypothetical protein EOP41_08515 [Sphingobacteriaceae bacterium]
MKSMIICLLAVVISSSVSFAQKSESVSINSDNYQHPQQYFLDHYGTDDSTKALVNYYFKRRRGAAVETVVGLVFTSGIISGVSGSNASFFIIVFAPVIFISTFLIIDGSVTRLIYTRRKLLHLLADYQSGKHLPRKITRNRYYKRELRNIYPS